MPLQNLKRVKKDLEEINNNLSYKQIERIYIHIPDPKNLAHIKALIVGPKATPYEGGFFFFDMQIPDNYPQTPPKVVMETLDQSRSVRFNPNLYIEGKVCLSILGTWSGPSWTPAMSLSTVLTSIQSLMSEKPYTNEPGYENASDKDCSQYNDCINYYTFDVAILKQLKQICKGHEPFKNIIEKIMVMDYEEHIKRAKNLESKMEGKAISAPGPFSSMKATCNYKNIQSELTEFYNKLHSVYKDEIAKDAKVIADMNKADAVEINLPDSNTLASRLALIKSKNASATKT